LEDIHGTINYIKNLAINKYYGTLLPEFYPELKKKYEEEVEQLLEEYLNRKDTIVLCQRCHYAIEHNKKLCVVCKKNYHSHRYELCRKCSESYSRYCPVCEESYITIYHDKCPICKKKYFEENKFATELFSVSKNELFYRGEELGCIMCGKDLFYKPLGYLLYYINNDSKIRHDLGNICQKCYERYQNEYKSNPNDIISVNIDLY